MSDKLPAKVLKLLGDDATPKTAIKYIERFATLDAYMRGLTLRSESEQRSATNVWSNAIAAAALRECEAELRWDETRAGSDYRAWCVARKKFRALRDWRLSLAAKK